MPEHSSDFKLSNHSLYTFLRVNRFLYNFAALRQSEIGFSMDTMNILMRHVEANCSSRISGKNKIKLLKGDSDLLYLCAHINVLKLNPKLVKTV